MTFGVAAGVMAAWLALRELGMPGIRSCVRPAAQNTEVPAVQTAAVGTDPDRSVTIVCIRFRFPEWNNDLTHDGDAQRLAETMGALAVNLAAEHNQHGTLKAIVAAAVTTVAHAR